MCDVLSFIENKRLKALNLRAFLCREFTYDKLWGMDHRGRIAALAEKIAGSRLDGLLITHLPNIRYLCGFSGSSAAMVVTQREAAFFTDGRYREQSKKEVQGCKIRIGAASALAQASTWLGSSSLRRIGIDAAHLTVAEHAAVTKALAKGARLVKAPDFAGEMRAIKDIQEISRIRDACDLGSRLFGVLLRKMRSGLAESEVAGELELAARKAGADQMSFPTIIAGGRRSALPHGRASDAVLPPRGFVVCDFGVILAGYCSDMTRTLHLGRPKGKVEQVYEAVRQAQQSALDTVRPGKTVGEVDLAARRVLKEQRLDRFFTHSTGHGVGLEIHEGPRVASGGKDVLKPGMVVTIEPGVYLPGQWGVRIEDTVVVTPTGCEILTKSRKELITL